MIPTQRPPPRDDSGSSRSPGRTSESASQMCSSARRVPALRFWAWIPAFWTREWDSRDSSQVGTGPVGRDQVEGSRQRRRPLGRGIQRFVVVSRMDCLKRDSWSMVSDRGSSGDGSLEGVWFVVGSSGRWRGSSERGRPVVIVGDMSDMVGGACWGLVFFCLLNGEFSWGAFQVLFIRFEDEFVLCASARSLRWINGYLAVASLGMPKSS